MTQMQNGVNSKGNFVSRCESWVGDLVEGKID